jgi:polyhydroxybutyrate depolymerase
MDINCIFSGIIAAAIACFLSTSGQAQNTIVNEGFDDAALPEGWSQQTLSDDGGWIGGDNTSLQSDWWGIEPHGNFIATNDDACDCDKSADYLVLPQLDLSAVEGLLLSFASYFSGELFQGSTEVATVEYSLDEGLSWTVLQTVEGNGDSDYTVWENVSINLSSLAGNANVLVAFRYNDDGGWMFGWGIDDVLVYEPQGLDVELTSLSMASNVNVGGELAVAGLITNVGADLIQSVDITWTSGDQDNVQGFSDLNLATGESYAFTHQDVFVAATMGNNDIEVGISNVNGTGDDNTENNTLIAGVMVIEYGGISSGAYEREYIYYHPGDAPANCPLVFVCHGYSGSADGIMNYSDFNSLADEYGFAVCYPQGIEDSYGYTFFNVGYDFQNGETVDDVAFLEELTDLFVAENSVDPGKVFCTGMSNGGDLCYLLACEASETFAGVAPVAGMIMQDILDVCAPSQTVGILEIHGTDDNVTYFDGDPQNLDDWGAYPSIPATIDFWVNFYGIGPLESGTFSDIAPNDGSTVSYDKYGLDGDCGEVWLYTVQGGGHDWPGAFGNMDINSSREAWLFFEQLCSEPVGIDDALDPTNRGPLVQVVDALGRTLRHSTPTPGALLLYIYENGSVEKVIAGE